MKIDFVSDVVCPWCAIGLTALEQAIARLDGAVPIDLRFQPFELNPDMPPGGADVVEYLSRKYGMSAEQVARNGDAIRERGAALGFAFGKRERTYNSFDAHRLLFWAETAGHQRALKHALLKAYFTDGLDPGDHALLARLACEVGLDADEARAILASDRYVAEVRARERHFQSLGIQAVPSVIVDDQHLIQGGQPVEVFEKALRELA
jgi:predicted DsbA family dithiol-disulfide isomerase